MGFKTLPSKLSDAVLTVANVAALSDVTDPQEGDERYVADIDVLYMYTGAAWAPSASSSGAPLAPSRGGTGISNNDAATLTRSGSHALTVTTTGTTGVTLPTSGTLGAVPAAGVVKSSGTALTSETALSPANGGTGVANDAAATLTRSGNHAWTVTTSATSNTTMPAGTKTVVASGDIVNADIAAGAAIAGSKIVSATASVRGVVTGGEVPGEGGTAGPSAGMIGQKLQTIVGRAAAETLTSNVANSIASVTLTAGNWLVYGTIIYQGAVTGTQLRTSVTATTDTDPNIENSAANRCDTPTMPTSNSDVAVVVSPVYVSVTSNTLYYVVASSTHTVGTCKAHGSITAVRVG